MIVQCNLFRLVISLSSLAILCCPLLFFGLAQFSTGSNRNGPFPDFTWESTQDVQEEQIDQFGHNLQRLLALVNVSTVPFALTPPFLAQTLKADVSATGFQRASENEHSPMQWRSVHVTERGKDVVLVCGLPCSKGLEHDVVKWSYKLNTSDEIWGNVPNDYPRFFTVKFKDCDRLSVLVIRHVSDKEDGAMFKCHYWKKNAPIKHNQNETIIESVVELVLLDGSSDGVEPVNVTSELSDALIADSSANFNETDNDNRTLLFADFQQPSADDIPKLLKLLNVTKSITVDEIAPLETRNDFTATLEASPSNISGHPKMAVLRHSFNLGDRLLLQCANMSNDYRPDVRWFVANETADFLERFNESFPAEHNSSQLNWIPFEDDFPKNFLITLKNSGGNRLLVLLENKKPAIYKCSYKSRSGQTYEKRVHLMSFLRMTDEDKEISHVSMKDRNRLSARNETAVTARKGEKVLKNMLSWFQNTLDFYVDLLRTRANQSKQQSSSDVSKNKSDTRDSQQSFLKLQNNLFKNQQALLSRNSN